MDKCSVTGLAVVAAPNGGSAVVAKVPDADLFAADILGNPRVKWDAPDIGACECVAQLGSQVLVR